MGLCAAADGSHDLAVLGIDRNKFDADREGAEFGLRTSQVAKKGADQRSEPGDFAAIERHGLLVP